jgi:hypothetical protein
MMPRWTAFRGEQRNNFVERRAEIVCECGRSVYIHFGISGAFPDQRVACKGCQRLYRAEPSVRVQVSAPDGAAGGEGQ